MVTLGRFKTGLLVAAMLMLNACSTSSLFTSYPSQIKPIKAQIENGDFTKAEKKLSGKTDSTDKILYLMEQGRVSQLAGNYETSQKEYGKAIDAIRAHDDKALYTVSGGAAQANAVLINDNAIPYYGSPYEITLLHQSQALNFAALGDLEGALVEVRRASAEQKTQKVSHESELNTAKKSKANVNDVLSDQHFAKMRKEAATLQSSFQNAYTFYFSGLLYEAAGLKNDASIDYKKALALAPNNEYIQHNLNRVDGTTSKDPAKGQIVVIFEEGFIPAKEEFSIPLPTGAGLIKVTLPFYKDKKQNTAPLSITLNNNPIGKTQTLSNIQALASKTLSDNLTGIVAREVARQVTRIAAEHSAKNKDNIALVFATNLYAIITANADLRSWLTLPHEVQVLSIDALPGSQPLTVNYKGNSANNTVDISSGKTTLVIVQSMNNHLISHVYNL